MFDYKMIFSLLGGLGLFVFGMHIMSEGLQKAAGEKLKRILEILTTNKLFGVLVGTGVTAITQSSSATTVMIIGFVNAGLMNLAQAASVIMGSNIGTTITAQLIAFKFSDIAPLIIAIGVSMILFSKRKKMNDIGEIVLGFGMIFIGMEIMGQTMEPLKDMPEFKKIIISLGESPLLGVLIGTAMTAIIQSSGAFIAVLIALSLGDSISFNIAFPLLLGSNIGTCITAILASIGANKTAKKAALIHLTFNIVGTVIFMILYKPVVYIIPLLGGNMGRQIANVHSIFNVTNTIIQAPFIPILVKFVDLIIPGNDIFTDVLSTEYIDKRFLETPSIAVSQVSKEIVRMARLAESNILLTLECFTDYNEIKSETIYKKEELINYLEREITTYLVAISNSNISESESKVVTSFFHVINDIERIGDHAENLIELGDYKENHSLKFSEEALTELRFIYETVLDALRLSIIGLEQNNAESAQNVIEIEKQIDRIEKQLRTDHIDRLNKGICSPESGTIFLDAISNLERVGDHSNNIAQIVLEHCNK